MDAEPKTVYLLYHGTCNGEREDCSIFYTSVEVYDSLAAVEKRELEIRQAQKASGDPTCYTRIHQALLNTPHPDDLDQYNPDPQAPHPDSYGEDEWEQIEDALNEGEDFIMHHHGLEDAIDYVGEPPPPKTPPPKPPHFANLDSRCTICGQPVQLLVDGYLFADLYPRHYQGQCK